MENILIRRCIILGANATSHYAERRRVTVAFRKTSISSTINPYAYWPYEYELERAYVVQETQENKGSYIGVVTGTTKTTYPTNGINGSYWYVYKGLE